MLVNRSWSFPSQGLLASTTSSGSTWSTLLIAENCIVFLCMDCSSMYERVVMEGMEFEGYKTTEGDWKAWV